MSRKVCLILIDGLRADTARTECAFLMASVDAGEARAATMLACLPTISAPLYETIHTGMSPAEHGLLSNEAIRPSQHPNLFSELKAAGMVSAVVAHSYFHTLYGGSAFDPFQHVEINDPAAPIPHARYYTMEGSDRANPALPSETDLCAQAWVIALGVSPDYLLLHTSSCDEIGHQYTSAGREYRVQAVRADTALSRLIPRLRGAGYDVVVTADHGINADGHHGGDKVCLREVPFVAFSDALEFGADDRLDQRIIAPTILRLLGLEPPDTMSAGALL